MKSSCLFILLFLLFVLPSRGQSTDAFLDSLEAEIKLRMAEYQVTGVAVALVDDQQVLWANGFGFTDLNHSHPVDAETLFSLQSLSKTVTTTAVLMKVMEGKFHLDTPVKQYYPEFKVNSRYGDKESDKITLRHLLSHRSGLYHEAPLGSNYDTVTCTFEKHIQSFKDSWLRFPVGKFYSYSNMGTDVAGYLLSKSSGMRFEDYMSKELLVPLGMTRSTFIQSKAYASGNLAHGVFGDHEVPRIFISDPAAGGLYSCVSDMAAFISFQLRGCTINGKSVISAALLKEMYTVQFPAPGQSSGYGLGIRVKPHNENITVLFHNGGGYGYATTHVWIPQLKVGLVILSNDGAGSPFINRMGGYSLTHLIKWKLGKLPPPTASPAPRPISLTAAQLEKFVGNYKGNRNIASVALKDDNLVFTQFGNTSSLQAISENEFISGNGHRLQFHSPTQTFPACFVDINSINADFYIFNDREGEPAGPDDPNWKNLPGRYIGYNNLQPEELQVFVKNGYLYTSFGGNTRLLPFAPNLFFTTDGESVAIHGDNLIVGNRPFKRFR